MHWPKNYSVQAVQKENIVYQPKENENKKYILSFSQRLSDISFILINFVKKIAFALNKPNKLTSFKIVWHNFNVWGKLYKDVSQATVVYISFNW